MRDPGDHYIGTNTNRACFADAPCRTAQMDLARTHGHAANRKARKAGLSAAGSGGGGGMKEGEGAVRVHACMQQVIEWRRVVGGW